MDHVRIGLIGSGGSMAGHHLGYFGKMDRLKLTAVCDIDPEKLDARVEEHHAKAFKDGHELIASGEVDAILIATPHYDHPTYAKAAFERGVHVLTEKPVAVTAKAAAEVNAAYEQAKKDHPKLVYAAMFQQRLRPEWRTVKKLIDDGRVGNLMRVSWTITNWFRSQTYYNSGGWRATWSGEGGGVLLNQCPHNLDLFQWFVGMPSRVRAVVGIGQHHDIEVEDDVSALLEFDNGATGTFVTSTSQTPGINRLEIVGEAGTIIVNEGEPILYREAAQNVREFTRTTPERFANVSTTDYRITTSEKDPGHRGITENFIRAILDDEPLIAQGVDGIHGLELGNAMLLSGLNDGQAVHLPTDRDAYDAKLKELIEGSTFQKPAAKPSKAGAMGGSF